MSSAYAPGGRTGNRSCPLSFVVIVAGPPINAGEVTRTNAPGRTAPCSSFTVPTSAPVKTWASAGSDARTHAAARRAGKQGRITHLRVVARRDGKRGRFYNVCSPHRHRRLQAGRVMPCNRARRAEEVGDEILRDLAPELRTVHVRMAEVHPAKHPGVHDFLLDVVEFVVRPDRW